MKKAIKRFFMITGIITTVLIVSAEITIMISPESESVLEPFQVMAETAIPIGNGLIAGTGAIIIGAGAIILGIGAMIISIVFPFGIIFAIYYAVKQLMKYEHDLNHKDEPKRHKNLWED